MTLQKPDQTGLSCAVAELRARLGRHPLYGAIRTSETLRIFVEHHVVCVLDFMSLLKSLQRDLTCVAVPWVPAGNPEAARLIHRIVLDEETDVRDDGRVMSHFACYLEAMEEVGADAGPARRLVEGLAGGMPLREALRTSALPFAAMQFGETTAELLERSLAARAAAFFRGREEIIPEMFLPILDRLERQGFCCPALRGYLQRHVQVDGEDHGPQAEQILARLCRGSAALLEEAEDAALVALTARERLWDAIAMAARATTPCTA